MKYICKSKTFQILLKFESITVLFKAEIMQHVFRISVIFKTVIMSLCTFFTHIAYLRESRPLALSRKRDAWLLVGAASAGFVLLAFVLVGLIFTARKKKLHSTVVNGPPNPSTLKKKQYYAPASTSPDNAAFSTSKMKIKVCSFT